MNDKDKIWESYISEKKKETSIYHTWATHATRRVGEQVEGKVVYHTLTEDGQIEYYNVEWPDGTVEENIPATDLNLTVVEEHSHGPKKKKK